MSRNIRSLADLADSGYTAVPAKECLAGIVRRKVLAGEELFTDIFGIETQKRRFVEVLAAGRGALLTGEFGVAKTDLAGHILDLLNQFYSSRELFAVEQCPVQEDPETLLRFISRTGGASEPCPVCRHAIAQSGGDLSRISVRRLGRLVEGTGFARVRGGGEVMPEEIIGTYNLLKPAQPGDPFAPRVFRPGKIGQSSRGLLFVDEIGKLPETAQNALIQASQESIVTPAKSRETFPVDFLLVATTNPLDEEHICGAVRDRMVSIEIPLAGLEDELRIVRREVEKCRPQVYIPRVFLKLAVEVVRAMRRDDRLEAGPRTSITAGLAARSSALLEGRCVASLCNVKEGIYTAVLGKAVFEGKQDIRSRLDEIFPDCASYIEREIGGVSLPGILQSCRDGSSGWSGAALQRQVTGPGEKSALQDFARWTYAHESIHRYRMYEVMAAYLEAYERGCPTGDL